MRRVVVTGIGAVSCIGNNQAEILDSLKNGRSGIVANESFAEMGLRSQVSGTCDIELKEHIERSLAGKTGELEKNGQGVSAGSEKFDTSLPGKKELTGSIHPISQVLEEITTIFFQPGISGGRRARN